MAAVMGKNTALQTNKLIFVPPILSSPQDQYTPAATSDKNFTTGADQKPNIIILPVKIKSGTSIFQLGSLMPSRTEAS